MSITPRSIYKVRNCTHKLSIPENGTPRNNYKNKVPYTPDCFSSVQMETPIKCRRSRDKIDEITNLVVAVRVRPMNAKELSVVGVQNVVKVKNQELIVRSGSAGVSTDHIFQYDHIFWSCDESSSIYSDQENVFNAIGRPLLNSAFKGYNACLFAYGQTGSGKSFSMMGRNNFESIDIDSNEDSGIIPRFCRDLFQRISQLDNGCSATVEVSYFEIYNEKIHDLLKSSTNTNKQPLKVREHPEWGPYVVDLSCHTVKTYEELRTWLVLGNKNRATAATNMNDKSSRSHSIFSIELSLSSGVNEEDSRRSKVSLVDLAGSERLGTSHNNEEKIKQGVSINKSLLTLGKVISALADQRKKQFVPYRDSVLTWLLKESLGGNSLTSMLATITPTSTHLEETLSTLRYACQARSIVNRARINENPHDRIIRELRSEVERLNALKSEYEKTNSLNSSLNLTEKVDFDELKLKLIEAEQKLCNAERDWIQRFKESEEINLRELAESEVRREELESQLRILKKAECHVNVSPFQSDFLKNLENILNEDDNTIQNTINYFNQKGLNCTYDINQFKIIDRINRKRALCTLNDVLKHGIEKVFQLLQWNNIEIGKNEIITNFNRIYQSLNNLKPHENDNNLNLLFAKVNKSLQSYETALLNNYCKNNQKNVTFNL